MNLDMPLAGYWFGLLHGFNISDGGELTLDQTRSYLEALGATVVEFDRDWDGLLESSLERNAQADRVALAAKRASARYGYPARMVLVGHSHGCSIIQRAFERDPHLQTRCQRVVFVNAALRVDAMMPTAVRVRNYFSPSDTTVTLAKWLRVFPWRWFMKHPWGEAGRKGLRGATNVNLETLMGAKVEHSTVFKVARMTKRLVEDMAGALTRAIQNSSI